METLKLIRIGDAVGVVLPKDVLARLNVDEGDAVVVTETSDGITLTPREPPLETQGTEAQSAENQLETARRIMARRHAVLRELAK